MIRIIPAIDVIDGKCVRLTQGNYSRKTIYNEDPLEVAKTFEQTGIRQLHLVDLDGAKADGIVNLKVLERITTLTQLHVDFGGGVKTNRDIELAFESGAHQVTIGSAAVTNREFFISQVRVYGACKIILGADVKDQKIAIHGWKNHTPIDVFDFIASYLDAGVEYVICTDILKDGMLQGVSIDLYRNILNRFSALKLIASGGIATIDDIDQLAACNMHGVIIGKALYENKISLKTLRKYAD